MYHTTTPLRKSTSLGVNHVLRGKKKKKKKQGPARPLIAIMADV